MRLHRLLLSLGLLYLVTTFLAGPALTAGPTLARRTAIVEAVERVRPAVVNIHSERVVKKPTDDLFALAPSQSRVNGMGTGIVIDPRGYIITNQHVVEDVNLIRVRLADGTALTAKVLARDPETDLALLKVDVSRPLATMPLGTAHDLMVGETVIAIGNAYGYEHTVSTGIVSAVKRDVTLNKEVSYKSLIQTDAAINPGNSGGPLLNIHGELVGVNVAIRAGAQGIGFAIPVDTMIRAAADMMSIRKRNGTWHGLIVRDCVDTSQPAPTRSLVVERTESNSPALRAGLQTGDIIRQVADRAISHSLDLECALLGRSAGDTVPVVVLRNGQEQRLALALQNAERLPTSPSDLVWRKLGLKLSPVQPELVSRTHQQLHGGLAVAEVQPDSVAARAGIQRGDILVGLHQWETLTLDNVVFVLTHPDLPTFNPLRFYIVRSGQVHRGWLQNVE